MLEFLPSDFGTLFSTAFENLKYLLGAESPIDMAVRIAGAYLVAIWLASVIWTVRDITDRTGNVLIQTFSVLLVVLFTPILGLPLYLLIRPRTTLAEKYYEEAGLAESEYVSVCPKCEGEVGEDFRFCPNCGEELLDACANCGAPKEKDWKFCAVCGSDGKTKKEAGAKEEKKPKKSARNDAEEKADKKMEGVKKTDVSETAPKKSEAAPVVVSIEEIPEAGKK